MLRRYFLLFAVIFCFSASAIAQGTSTVSGILTDSLTKKPIAFGTVNFQRAETALKTVLTDSAGRFTHTYSDNGSYQLSLASIGYTTKKIKIDLNGRDHQLGTILLQPAVGNLGEVAVTGNRPVIRHEADRIAYDVQADAESKTLTVLDMMRKVPLLSVDADDNIKLKGSGNFKILINNRPSGMVTRDPKEVLRTMPAASIQKIEVITTPPSRFDAEGLSGIINIITTKKVDNGYNGSVNVRHQTPGGPGANVYLTWKQGRFGADLSGGTGIWKVSGIRVLETRITTGANATTLVGAGNNSVDNKWLWGTASLSYELDTLNLLTLEINPYGGYNRQITKQQFNLSGQTNSAYNTENNRLFEWRGSDYTANYQRGFRNNKDHLLTFSYKHFSSREPNNSAIAYLNRQNFNLRDVQQENKSSFREQTAQADYVVPIRKVTLEAGLKAILREGSTDFQSYTLNPGTQIYELQVGQSNGYSNEQNVYGAYTSAALAFKKFTLKGGARIEYTYVKGLFATGDEQVRQNYFNVIPTLSLNRKLRDGESISLGFTQRIERPAIYFLNPFVDRSRPNIEQYGNPDLVPVLSNNFDLGYSYSKKGSLNLGFSYNFANNTQQTVLRYDPASNITRITFLNIGRDRKLGANLNINYPVTAKWNVSANGNLNYIWLEGMIEGLLTRNSGMTGYVSANSSYKFEKTWKTTFSFNYGAPDVLLQGASNDYYFMAVSGSKDLIKDKLIVSAMAANPFRKFRAYTNFVEGSNFSNAYSRENYFRRFNVNLVWKFGKLQGSIRKNERRITNDDVKSQSAG
ncbi:outer membrane beta-barrel protein [Pedobacter sp. SYP-B3415]|uniref:outer membrane beta-barrel protein n=1 Tax=Pedobacter sp. SYP-B3415 TaxID=2496641 RepID=UPI0013EDDC50|nr:outer membrane beta-barrel protein [Pedobacter sp. SYP-B3415]